jgi:hypothetical protein
MLVTVPLAKVKFVLAISISWFLSSWDKVLMQVNQSEPHFTSDSIHL